MAHRVRHLRAAALVLLGALCLSASAGHAAGRIAEPKPKQTAKAKAAGPATIDPKAAEAVLERAKPAAVWTSGEQERACYHARRKLWQDGQGWVVKRVAVCP